MQSVRFLFIMTLVVSLFGALAMARTDEGMFAPSIFKITKKDSRGRPETVEIKADKGTCMAQVVYNRGVPQIYVLVISRAILRNLGFRQINDGTEEGISKQVLMRNIEEAITEQCLPLIIPGSANV